MMGVETPIPLFTMDAAAPKGRPRGGSIPGKNLKDKKLHLPRRASERP